MTEPPTNEGGTLTPDWLAQGIGSEGGTCPACNSASPSHDGLWWSKAGCTSQLCDEHKEQARDRRRVERELRAERWLRGKA
jgi:hypothetical protein